MSRFLDKVELAFTCPLRWEKLVGGDTERFCGSCQKHVTNLSAMSRHEAAAFLRSTPGPICVRVEVDDKGRSVHRPSLSTAAMSLSLIAGAPVHSCNEARDATPVMMGAPPAMMGAVAILPPPVEQPAMLGQVPVQPMMGKIAVPEKMGDYRMPTEEDASRQ
jgi:hypothetical protein